MQLPYSNMQVRIQNEEASLPLIIPIANFCNTTDEHIYANIKANSATCRNWLAALEPHGGVAVICGSGPSLADNIGLIRGYGFAAARPSSIFALNGAARYLADQFIEPDYQVILDARPETADLIETRARQHLFASQVHPSLFEKVPTATLWHLWYEWTEKQFEEIGSPGPYTLIGGGGVSVGCSVVALAYALGYRTMHFYGLDSSHRDGQSHAFSQPLNDGDPLVWVEFGGKKYLCSFTMKLQAEEWIKVAHVAEDRGVTIKVHGEGLLPDMWRAPPMTELEKYTALWADPNYRSLSPGESAVSEFVQMCEIRPFHHVADFGCGTGRGAAKIAELSGALVTPVDFAPNCLDEEAKNKLLHFYQADLSDHIPVTADYGFCTDVMEHIPPEQIKAVIQNIMAATPICYFQIATVPDVLGCLIGQRLHLSIHPLEWWQETFHRLGYVVRHAEARGSEAILLIAIR